MAAGKTVRVAATKKKATKPAVVTRGRKPRRAQSAAAPADGTTKDPAPTKNEKSAPTKKKGAASRGKSAMKASKDAGRQSLSAAPEALVIPDPRPLTRGQHRDMGVVAGSEGPTACFNAGATDLCEIVPGGQVAVAGDTWKGPKAFAGKWSPSLALHVKSLAGKVEFDGSFGWQNLYRDSWGPDGGPPPPACSQLPAGTVRVGAIEYLMVTRTQDLKPLDSRLVVIDPKKPGWKTVPGSLKPASWENSNQTQISGCEGPDGFVYIVADSFDRKKHVVMYRCRPETFRDRDSWAGWGMVNGDSAHWGWGVTPPAPLHPHLFGELSFRFIDGKFVLSALNDTCHQIEVRVADVAHQVLNPGSPHLPPTPCTVVVDWVELPFLYGGYIVPGSTLDKARILVSQWLDPKKIDDPYNVREYEVNLYR